MRLACMLAAALLLAPVVARADAAAEPKLTQHVTDRTGTLSAQQLAALEAPLVALEQRKGAQLAILVISSTGDQTIEEYSLAVAEANKLGRAKPDDGLLLLVAKDDRKARIEVGYGLEGAVTDAMSSRIIREYLAPKFRQDDYFGGLQDAEGALVKLVDGEALPAPLEEAPDDGPPPVMLAIFVGLIIGFIASATGLKPATFRRLGAGLVAGVIGWLVFSAGLAIALAAIAAFLSSGSPTGRFGSGSGGWGSFPGGGGGWGRGGGGSWGGGGGGGWSGGGGSFGGGGASGGW
jgi:uncharacterized protein